MKRLIVILLTVIMLLSAAVAEELNHLWDIPFGIPLDEAAAMFTEKTGFELQASSSGPQQVFSNDAVILADTAFMIKLTGFPVENSASPFRIVTLDKSINENEFTQDGGVLGIISQLYTMLDARFGDPTSSGVFVRPETDGMPALSNYLTYDIPIKNGTIDEETISSMRNAFTYITIVYDWNNVSLSCAYLTNGDINIGISAAQSKISVLNTGEYKGDYTQQPAQITSF